MSEKGRTAPANPSKVTGLSSPAGWREAAFRLIASGGSDRLTLSNRITLIRILILPVFVLFILQGTYPARGIASAIFALAVFTDWLDGYLARTRGQITPFGEILDPVADKLLVTAALIPLVALGEVDSWIVGIILGRELLVTALRAMALRNGVVIAASRIGKTKMFLEVAAIVFLLLKLFPPLGIILIWSAMIVSIVSAVDYFRHILQEVN